MRATAEKPWVAVGAWNHHVYARSSSVEALIRHMRARHWHGIVVEHHRPARNPLWDDAGQGAPATDAQMASLYEQAGAAKMRGDR